MYRLTERKDDFVSMANGADAKKVTEMLCEYEDLEMTPSEIDEMRLELRDLRAQLEKQSETEKIAEKSAKDFEERAKYIEMLESEIKAKDEQLEIKEEIIKTQVSINEELNLWRDEIRRDRDWRRDHPWKNLLGWR